MPKAAFNPMESERIFRIMASDYTECTLLPALLKHIRKNAPGVCDDVLTPVTLIFMTLKMERLILLLTDLILYLSRFIRFICGRTAFLVCLVQTIQSGITGH